MEGNVAGILLAAGFGRRFDPSGQLNKLMAPMRDGQPVAWHSARAMCTALPQTYAVVRNGDDALAALLREAGCELIIVPAARDGMGPALAGAIAAIDIPTTGWVVGLADMPWVWPHTIRHIAAAIATPDTIVAPQYSEQRGNPVGFGIAHGDALRALTGDKGARDLLQHYPVTLLQTDDPGVLRDVDAPADIAVAL